MASFDLSACNAAEVDAEDRLLDEVAETSRSTRRSVLAT